MSVYHLSEDLVLEHVEGIFGGLKGLLARTGPGAPIEIDLSSVRDMDGAGLQMLLCFWHAAAESGSEVTLHGASKGISDLLDEVDVADRFRFSGLGAAL